MKTSAHSFAINVLGRAMTLLVLSGTTARAQQALEIPLPANQGPALSYHRPKPTPVPTPPAARVETIPSVPQAPPPELPPEPKPPVAQPAPEPVLPAIFRGCWEGRVDYLDSFQRLPGGAKIGPWTPKTYRLCYVRRGNGPFELTFTEAGVVQSRKITNAVGRMDLLSSDGRTYATMRALLHFDEYRAQPGYFGRSTFPVDELTQLECNVEPDGMQVWGQVYGQQSGQPWFKAYWHTTFRHAAGEPPVPE